MPDKVKKKGIFHVNLLKEWKEREALWGEVKDEEFGPETKDFLNQGMKIDLGDDLMSEQEQQMREIEHRYREVFSGRPGNTNLVEHAINNQPQVIVRSGSRS